MSAANQLPHLMTVAAFLDWESPDGSDCWELVDGMPEAIAPAPPRHGLMRVDVARILGNHLAESPHCRLVIAPGVQPRAGQDNYNVRVPDLAVTSQPVSPADRLLHAPLLIVEILSPSDWRRTWSNVSLYTTIAAGNSRAAHCESPRRFAEARGGRQRTAGGVLPDGRLMLSRASPTDENNREDGP